MALTPISADLDIIAKLSDEPNDVDGLSAAALKAKFDEGANALKTYINTSLIPELESDIDAASQGVPIGTGIDGSRLIDGTVTDAKITGLGGAKIDNASIDAAAKLVAKSITRAQVASDVTTIQAADFPNKIVPQRALADQIISTVKIEDEAITEPKIAPKSVTRAKQAQDALYSPIIAVTSSRAFAISDLAGTLTNRASSDLTLTMNAEVSATFPIGSEIAVLSYYNGGFTIAFAAGVRSAMEDVYYTGAKNYKLSTRFKMAALKKVESSSGSGDLWVLTGSVEVV